MTNKNQTKRIGDWQKLLMGIGFWILLSALLAQLAIVFSGAVLNLSLSELSPSQQLSNKEWWGLVVCGLFFPSLSFVLAPYVLSKIFRYHWANDLTLNRKPIADQLFLSFLLFLFSYAAVGFLLQINQNLTLPSELSEVMKTLEDQSNKIYQMVLQKNRGVGSIAVVLFMAFFPALMEEIFFRGFVMKRLIGMAGNFHTGIWLSSFLFAFIHVQPLKLLPMILLGGILGYVAYFSRSIWASVSIHFLNNGLAVLQDYLNKWRQTKIPALEEDFHINPLLALASFVAIIALLFLMNKKEKKLLLLQKNNENSGD